MDGAAGSLAVATSPVTYSRIPLEAWMQRPSLAALISPFGLEYMPCAHMPVIAWGVAQWPSLVVDWGGDAAASDATSPFKGVPDLFSVTRIPLGARPHLPRFISAYSVSVNREDAVASAVRMQTGA
jgi:hypothetical protein